MSPESNKQQQLPHVLMVSFPGHGHINPLLRLAKRVASKGLLVTITTNDHYGRKIQTTNAAALSDHPIPVGDGFIRLEFFPDDDSIPSQEFVNYLESVGRRRVPEMVARLAQEGRPISCIVNNQFVPWVTDVAEELGLPSALLWTQSYACFLCFYYYNHKLVPFLSENAHHADIEIPSLPRLRWDEVPTFLRPTTLGGPLRRAILREIENLSKHFIVLVDSFHALEKESVDHANTLLPCPMRPVGPLFQNPNSKHTSEKVTVDPEKADQECLQWLDGKEEKSVVYISFRTLVTLKQEQVEEVAAGIEAAGVKFLWVMKPPLTLPKRFFDKVGDNGKVVQFSPQEQVLAHPAVACFMTHCGWNSSIEALASGIPIVAFPSIADQVTNAKFLCEVYGVGVLLARGVQDGMIPREEIDKCLREATLGPKAAEMKKNALKWKGAAEKAVADGGSSDQNMQEFVNEVWKRSKIMLEANEA